MKKFLLSIVPILVLLLLLGGCSKDSDDGDNNTEEPQSFYYEPDIDNSFIDTMTSTDTVQIYSMTIGSGDSIYSGDTVDTRVINISGVIPDYTGSSAKSLTQSDTTISLHADGGSCMNSGPWNASDTFSIDFTQTISVSQQHYGVMCTGAYGFQIVIKDLAGNRYWTRDLEQSIGMDIDTTYGSLNLPPGTYVIDVSTVTGTDTYVSLTYTPGTGGALGAMLVVYQNGNLYPISEAEAGADYSYTIDLVRGGNTIRILVIGNFDPSAQLDIANILGASDIIDIFCMTDEIAIRAVLSWQIDNSDVDLHFVSPNSTVWSNGDCFYGNKTPEWGDTLSTLDNPILDVDNTSGYGPETMVLPSPYDGLYTVVIHYFSDHGGGDAPSNLVVTLNETTQRTYGPKTLTDGQYWIVTGINVTAGVAEFASAPDSLSLFEEPALARRIPAKK
ncbi:hypothetical protein J7L68_05990 [bacterium]|nr:hypothetical protein [bacterium]